MVLNRRDELDIRVRSFFAGGVTGFVAGVLLIMLTMSDVF
jgi:hypothetical protein